MSKDSTRSEAAPLFAGEAWFDPIEAGLRDRVRGFIEEMVEQELAAALGRGRYERGAGPKGYRNGSRERQLLGSFGPVAISVPRARLAEADGSTREWRSAALPRYGRRPCGNPTFERLLGGLFPTGPSFPSRVPELGEELLAPPLLMPVPIDAAGVEGEPTFFAAQTTTGREAPTYSLHLPAHQHFGQRTELPRGNVAVCAWVSTRIVGRHEQQAAPAWG